MGRLLYSQNIHLLLRTPYFSTPDSVIATANEVAEGRGGARLHAVSAQGFIKVQTNAIKGNFEMKNQGKLFVSDASSGQIVYLVDIARTRPNKLMVLVMK